MDWARLASELGGQTIPGEKLKSTSGWVDGNNGTNESDFNALPGGYRIENGIFRDIGSFCRSSSPMQRGEWSVALKNSFS